MDLGQPSVTALEVSLVGQDWHRAAKTGKRDATLTTRWSKDVDDVERVLLKRGLASKGPAK